MNKIATNTKGPFNSVILFKNLFFGYICCLSKLRIFFTTFALPKKTITSSLQITFIVKDLYSHFVKK